jgi:hypothetical protein
MHSQRSIAVTVGVLTGTLTYILWTWFKTDGVLEFYAAVKLGGLLIILFSCIIAGRFGILFKATRIVYEKIRYIGNRPHREIQISNDESLVVAVLISLMFAYISMLLIPSDRLAYGVLIGVFLARFFKLTFMYTTGYPCRLWWPLPGRSYRTTEIYPEPELRIFWKPLQVYSISILLFIYIATLPFLQNVTVRFIFFASDALANLGI